MIVLRLLGAWYLASFTSYLNCGGIVQLGRTQRDFITLTAKYLVLFIEEVFSQFLYGTFFNQINDKHIAPIHTCSSFSHSR